MSDNGGVVAYERTVGTAGPGPSPTPPATAPQVWIRDRVADSGRGVVELPSVAPGISGNGCVVAYTVPGVVGTRVSSTLTAVDRCATTADLPLPIGTAIDTVTYAQGAAGASPPAVSFDGSTIVWSTGREVRRYERREPAAAATLPTYERTHSFDSAAVAERGVVTGPDVDVSADGETIVFVAGPGSTPYVPLPSNVYTWTLATAEDGPDLLTPTAAAAPSAGESMSPSISADGAFVVFASSADDLAVTGGAVVVTPFVVGVDLAAGAAQVLLTDAARPTMSADGNHIAYVRGNSIRVLTTTGADTVDLAPGELGSARPGGRLAISQYGRWVMFASDADLAPPATGALSVWAADLTSSDPSPVDTTTTTTVPTTPGTTAPPSTAPPSTVPPSTTPRPPTTVPATSLPATVFVPRYPTGSYPGVALPQPPRSSTSGGGVSSRTATSGSTATVTPAVFEPTVAGVGVRTASAIVSNASVRTLTVTRVSLEPAGPFSIVSDACSGSTVVLGGSCSVEVQFAPVEVGGFSAVMTVAFADGSIVTATVGGEGVPDPTLDLVPAVAGAGQTVAVFGAGFPPGSSVVFVQPGVAVPEPLVVDPDGTFAHVVVVLPNTPTGAVVLSVVGQPNVFDDVTAELLVSSRGVASDSVALRSALGGSVAR